MVSSVEYLSTVEFLSELRRLDIHVSVEEGRLRCNAPAGRLTKELEKALVARKTEIIRTLCVSSASPSIPRRYEPNKRMPLSFAQERLWFQQNLKPESTAHNITARRPFQSAVNANLLERALHTLVRRHEILRTRVVEADGVPAQEVQPDMSPTVEIYDLSHLAGTDKMTAAESTIRKFSARRFNFASGCLFRVALIRLSSDDCQLVMTAHHIVCDGWSLGIFFTEFCSLYEAVRRGQAIELAGLPVQYGDYALWERERMSSIAVAPQLKYWKDRLKGAPASLEIPRDHPRTASLEYKPRLGSFQLDEVTSESLRRLARESAATPFMMLLAIFKALLARYTEQGDIVVGTPVSTRTVPELEGLIGCFINTQLLRTAVDQSITARELVNRVRTTVLESLSHADVPFEVLVRELVTKRDMSRSPLFQIAFVLLNTPGAQEYQVVSGGTDLDMTLYMWEAEGKFYGSLEYDGALFDPATISCFTGCFQTLAAQMASQPDTQLMDIALVSDVQAEEWFSEKNGPSIPLPADTAHEWVRRQAAASPEKIAVICGKEQLSFRDLWARAAKLAHQLRLLGVGPGSRVALCLNRTVDLVVAPLAVWQAGAAYVPLDPDYPAGRLAYMLRDAAASALVTESDLLKRLPSALPSFICLDRERYGHLNEAESPPPVSVMPDDLAYLIYTSGSTGNPKGVEIRHRSLVNLLASMMREPGITSADRLLAVTTLSFDIAGLELFLPLVSGAQVVIAPRSAVADGTALARLLTEFKITVMQATPVTWRLLLQSGWKGKPGLKILCGGEALPLDLAEQLLETGAELWNLYGPTETTIWSTVQRIEGPVDRIAIGHPIANTQICVLDESGRLLPPGLTGELFIGGEGLARGYWNLENLTAERFVESHVRCSGTRMYRTGDLVRRLSGGDVEYVTRADDQVKFRGHRIELGEIEVALGRHPNVAQAVVTVREDKPGDKKLIAYWTMRGHARVDAAELRKNLRRQLPDAMIPAVFIKLDSFPLTPNNKVDRKALAGSKFRAMLEENGHGKRGRSESQPADGWMAPERVMPSNYVEAVLEEIWRAVLQVEQISVHDNFFELGGDSLTTARAVSDIRAELDMDLPLRSIFVYPTIASLASHISFEPSTRRYSYTSEQTHWPRLVAAQPHGSRTPFFFLAGFYRPDGPLLVLAHLIPHLGKDQPVFGFQPRWMEEGGADYDNVEELAHEYIAELRKVQPAGPYLLGGNCVDGIAVVEMARLLQEQGEEVKLVALLDTVRPSQRRLLHMDLFFFKKRLEHIRDVLFGIVRARSGERLRMFLQVANRKLGIAISAEDREMGRFDTRRDRYRRLLSRHKLKSWSGRITLIRNEEELNLGHDFGWTGFSEAGYDIHVVPGEHETMLSEHGKEVAQIIRRCLDEAMAEPSEETEYREAGIL
ncbi:amino acid adenylation domain-containing protein [Terracidiphilus sp.]|uniref:non-ribosomal peptide synthetase n=1 Tax=Terracidiphilus sp. TaxID=1964191 RepID=UPI003C180748